MAEATALLERPSEDKIASPEKGAFRSLRVDYKDPALRLTSQARIAGFVIKELNVLKRWAYDKASASNFLEGDLDVSTIDGIVEEVNFRTEVLNAQIELTSRFSTEDKDVELGIPDVEPAEELPGATLDIPIEDLSQLQHFVSHSLVRIAHDVKNPHLNHIASFLQIIKKLPHHSEFKEKILPAFRKINSTIEDMAQAVPDEFKEKDISLTEIRNAFNKDVVPMLKDEGFNASDVNFLLDPNIPEGATVSMPFHIICGALRNIADNSSKSTADQRVFPVRVSLSGNGKNIEIVCEDKGEGYPENIVRLGFIEAKKEGVTGQWKNKKAPSTGVGMAEYTEMIEKFNGKLIPEKGENEIGARTRMILPVKLPASVVTI